MPTRFQFIPEYYRNIPWDLHCIYLHSFILHYIVRCIHSTKVKMVQIDNNTQFYLNIYWYFFFIIRKIIINEGKYCFIILAPLFLLKNKAFNYTYKLLIITKFPSLWLLYNLLHTIFFSFIFFFFLLYFFYDLKMSKIEQKKK